jgi:hypothetical protein
VTTIDGCSVFAPAAVWLVSGCAVATALAVVVAAAVASCAKAGVVAITSATGLTAAMSSEREEILVINPIPLEPARGRRGIEIQKG